MAAVRDQIDRARFGRYYPTLTLVTYPSNMEAFDAVFFGRDDILLGMPTPPTTSTASASTTFASGRGPARAGACRVPLCRPGHRARPAQPGQPGLAAIDDRARNTLFTQWNGPIRDMSERSADLYDDAAERAWMRQAPPSGCG